MTSSGGTAKPCSYSTTCSASSPAAGCWWLPPHEARTSVASGADEDTVVRGLDELWRRRIIRELGAVGYDFSHDKIREVAYQSLSPVLRRHLHRQVAQGLEKVYAEDLAAVSAQLARHYE